MTFRDPEHNEMQHGGLAESYGTVSNDCTFKLAVTIDMRENWDHDPQLELAYMFQ